VKTNPKIIESIGENENHGNVKSEEKCRNRKNKAEKENRVEKEVSRKEMKERRKRKW